MVCVAFLANGPEIVAGGAVVAALADPNPAASEGRVVIGETMGRVRAAGLKYGAETFETTAKTAKQMWKENSTWLRGAMREGKEIVDIGLDVGRQVRSKFYQAEKVLIENYEKVTRP